MTRSKHDGFRIKDAMLAIAATAIGFAWVQAQWDTIQLFAGQYADQPRETKRILGDRPLFFRLEHVCVSLRRNRQVTNCRTGSKLPAILLLLHSPRD
jgi:hypothetical protein